MEERNYKLYVHISPNNKRYYGITCQKYAKYRWDSGHGYRSNKHFTNAINKYSWDNFQHLVLFNNLTKEEACLLEQMYIALYNTTNSKYGYNQSYGGESCNGINTWERMTEQQREKRRHKVSEASKNREITEETRNKLRQSAKGNKCALGHKLSEESKKRIGEANKGKRKGIALSEETKKKMSEAHKGKQVTEETKRKLSAANKGNPSPMKGKHHTDEARKKLSESHKGKTLQEAQKKKISNTLKHSDDVNRKKVKCIETGIIYNSMMEAQKAMGKPNGTCISNCAIGKQNTAYGYHWCYLEDLDNYTIPINKTKGKKIRCIELNLIFNSAAEANEYLGKPRRNGNIGMNLTGRTNTAYGYHWEYVTEEQVI